MVEETSRLLLPLAQRKQMTTATIIYLRTSTEFQNPLNQLEQCKSVNQFGEYELIQDKDSAWKDIQREGFEKIKELIKSSQIKHLIVWDLDRIFRNRKRLIEFFKYCKHYNCKIHSYRQGWLEQMNDMPPPWNEIIYELMLQIMGWLSEEESLKKSERVKAAVRRMPGQITKSYLGKKWGKPKLSKNVRDQVIELHNAGKTLREIAKQVFYWNRHNHKKQISKSAVHKYISENSTTELSQKGMSKKGIIKGRR